MRIYGLEGVLRYDPAIIGSGGAAFAGAITARDSGASVSRDATARSAVIKTEGEPERELAYGQILVAAGRRPVSAGLDLSAAGVKTGGRGEVVDEYQRTANPRTWAAGDVTGGPQFVYAAANALFSAERTVDYAALCPNTTFHTSRGTARAYLAARGNLDAEILDQDAAIECGRVDFGSLLGGSPR